MKMSTVRSVPAPRFRTMDWSGRVLAGAESGCCGLGSSATGRFRACEAVPAAATGSRGVLSAPLAGVTLCRGRGWPRTEERGIGDGSPAAQDCRLTASESLPGGGARARARRSFRLPVGDQLPVGDLALLAERPLARAHLFQVVGVGGAALAAAGGHAGAQ